MNKFKLNVEYREREMKSKNVKRTKWPTVFKLLSGVFMTVVLLLAVLLAGTRVIGLTPYAVVSGSMEPQFPVGSLIYVKSVEPSEVSVGDPITYVMNESLMVATHRVVGKSDEGNFITKGDANDTVDGSTVHPKNLLGKPLFAIPYLGYLSVFLASGQGKIVLLGVLLILVFSLFLPEGKKKAVEREVAD